jgi:CRISPR-associated protein Cmr4
MTNGAAGTPRAFRLYGLLAETFVHAGIGQARAAIDLPVARESTTGYPYVAGSSGKGAARDAFRRHWWVDKAEGERAATLAENILFGPETGGADVGSAGELIFSDMRLLLLPVRSLTGACRYVTCPELIYRLVADLNRAGLANDSDAKDLADTAPALIPGNISEALSKTYAGHLYLEELCFKGARNTGVAKLAACVSKLLPPNSGMGAFIGDRLTIVSDDAFAWFAENALPARMRNALEGSTKKVVNGALWSEEYLAPDTLLYMLVGTRGSPAASVTLADEGQAGSGTPCKMGDAFGELMKKEKSYFQVGGNETVGHGWFRVSSFGGVPAKGSQK